MPDFQFTPILNVKTDDAGRLVELDWDWADSGQGQWDENKLEHEQTLIYEQACGAMDKRIAGNQWPSPLPDLPLGTQMHAPVAIEED